MRYCGQGIPNGCRARALLFTSQTLIKKKSAYPHVGQKRLNGASSRMMLYFVLAASKQISEDHHEVQIYRCKPGSSFLAGYKSNRFKFKWLSSENFAY